MDFGTFSERVMDFSKGEIGSFGGVVLIPFRASDRNPSIFENSTVTLKKVSKYDGTRKLDQWIS